MKNSFPYVRQPRKLVEADGAETISEAKTNLTILFWQDVINSAGQPVCFIAWNDLNSVGHAHAIRLERMGHAKFDPRFGGWFIGFDKWFAETMAIQNLRKVFEAYRDNLAKFIVGSS